MWKFILGQPATGQKFRGIQTCSFEQIPWFWHFHIKQSPKTKRKRSSHLDLQHPLHNVLSNNTLKATSSVIQTWSIRYADVQMPVLGHSSREPCWPHHLCNGRKWFRPGFIVSWYRNATRIFQVRWVCNLLCQVHVCTWPMLRSLLVGCTDLSRWFQLVQPSQYPVTNTSPNFQISLLYVLVNLDRYITFSMCPSGKE